ncbi:S41 family peptidase [Sediminibacillus albus]|uniref:C-terminal processing peptidase n=1 Tax=Sediminibacillus albus TaxID=407036 RepID=A0A1G8YPS9_9BACI|nr:S41 family peptidase [Sediminibacillus albus]SDK04454.1 carboxyl-terminal processing protease [Sediminibacillus albus]
MNLKKRYIAAIMVAALLLGALGAYFGVQLATSEDSAQQQAEDGGSPSGTFADLSEEEQQQLLEGAKGTEELDKVAKAYSLIQESYLEEVDKSKLIEGAIQGMMDSLEDPYSVYMDQETVEEFNHSIESSFEGIGAEVSMVDGKVTIIAPIKDSPAEAAGLKPNDQILKVDDESVEGLDLYDAVSKIRGEQGSKVTLEISRPGVSDPLTIELTRDDIPLETVYSETKSVNGKKAGIIEITSFSEGTAKRFDEELAELEKEEIEGLVIDVRGNPGGLFTAVEDILKNFIPKDTPYVQIEDRKGEKSRYFSELDEKKGYPITVLIDEGSASASEILAGAMKEAGDSELVGTKSFGKGTVQQAIPLGDGSTIKMTLFKWLTPDGNWIHERGIEPTMEVKQPDYFYTNPIQIEQSLEVNQSNDKIKNAQIMLAGLGYKPGNKDGSFDQKTAAAVQAFQGDNDLEKTGSIDEQTANKLQTEIIEKIRNGENDRQKQKALEALFD